MNDTRQQILDYIHRERRATVRELAAMFDMTATGVRQHLAILVREGLVATREERGRVGRPAHVFQLTERGEDRFPTRYDELTNLLLEEVRAMAGAEAYQRVLQRIAKRMAAERMDRVDGLPLADRVRVATDILREQGCIADAEAGDNEFFIHQCTCPYPTVARKNRAVCALEVDFIRRLTAADARLVTSLLRGDRACTYRIRPVAKPGAPSS